MAVAVQPEFSLSVRSFTGTCVPVMGDRHRHDVHVWLLPNDTGIDLSDFWRVLSIDETERAARFRFEADRTQFVRTRGSLRLLLESYLGLAAGKIVFGYSEYGKPTLAKTVGQGLEFNVSHTQGMAIIGCSRACRVGVDVESLRENFSTAEVAERFFSPGERIALRNIAAEHRHEAFFRIWTRKEAYIKARGEGLSHPLHQFDVSVDDAAALIATRPDAAEKHRWRLENIVVPPGFVAAVAVETAIVSSAAS